MMYVVYYEVYVFTILCTHLNICLLFLLQGGKKLTNTAGNEVCQKGQHCGKYDEFAKRDIKAGEEVLCNYGTFYPEYPGKAWDKFGL